MKVRERYQAGGLRREPRKKGAAVWTLQWRESDGNGETIRRKQILGTVEEFPTKASALKACEFLRSTINRETRTPRTVTELVEQGIAKQDSIHPRGLRGIHLQMDHSEMGKLLIVRRSDGSGGNLAWHSEAVQWITR